MTEREKLRKNIKNSFFYKQLRKEYGDNLPDFITSPIIKKVGVDSIALKKELNREYFELKKKES